MSGNHKRKHRDMMRDRRFKACACLLILLRKLNVKAAGGSLFGSFWGHHQWEFAKKWDKKK
jgi:hypothetical protein